MVPHQAVDKVLQELLPFLQKGDTVIDGGNSPYKESIRRFKELKERGIYFLDVGVSGGPSGARNGACIMVGGGKEIFRKYKNLFRDLACTGGYAHMGKPGAGHFVKMVHNGIEYGMMQALAEGFALMKASPFDLNLTQIAKLYNHKSVVESRLVGWLHNAFSRHGEHLDDISGTVSHSGEGSWTVEAAEELGIPVPGIEGALNFRIQSQAHPSYTGQILSAVRNQFGGHEVFKKST
jgi:6-phosphogluconate dehydrogenase